KGPKIGEPLRDLYQRASIFIYPSFYEGFGFPIVEAFASGVSVVTSKTSSCAEIAGDSALLIDPLDHREIGEAILKLIKDEDLREGLVKKGIERAGEFTWNRTAKEVLKLFSQ
ncbi:glycosyltransferase, partial [Candidatus Omnitrophota bacterium]